MIRTVTAGVGPTRPSLTEVWASVEHSCMPTSGGGKDIPLGYPSRKLSKALVMSGA